MTDTPASLDIESLRAAYGAGSLTPRGLMARIRARIGGTASGNVWIHVLTGAEAEPYLAALEGRDPHTLPLYGIPFAIKDNIDLAGVPTTAGCPDFRYVPKASAFVVQRLIAAGALPVGKTNMDQFATGLTGTRSPYGPVRNSFAPEYIAGGSSSGSAVAVAAGLASFALGTDTAGSGRVPAAFNNLVGLKPTRGLLSTTGVVPACRSLDCVSLFALNADDARTVFDAAAAFDAGDAYARENRPLPAAGGERFRFGVPAEADLEFFGNQAAQHRFGEAVKHIEALGGEAVTVDFAPFTDAARLLYAGPWVAERYAAIEAFLEAHPRSLLPVTHRIIAPSAHIRAVEAFKAQYRLMALQRECRARLEGLDFVVTPTAGTIYTLEQIAAEPVDLNTNLGYYTNFMNLIDLSAIAVPGGFLDSGLPFGVTLFAPAFSEDLLLRHARALQRAQDLPMGAGSVHWQPAPGDAPRCSPGAVRVVVCGAHMAGLPLNHQLTERSARLVAATCTAPCYGLYALPGAPPLRPGLIRDPEYGAAIAVEVWEMPVGRFGDFVAAIPAPLGIGSIELADGSFEKGFLCEAHALGEAREITRFGGWRAFLDAEADAERRPALRSSSA